MKANLCLILGLSFLLSACSGMGSASGTSTQNQGSSDPGSSDQGSLPSPAVGYNGIQVPAACAAPKTSSGDTHYLDPAGGNNANAGSTSAPWGSLQSVISAGFFTNGKIKAGDTLLLRGGNHGAVTLKTANSDFITVAAETGQTPVVSKIVVQGSKFILRGLTVRALRSTLVDLSNSNNVILQDSHLLSQENVDSWSQADWRNNASAAVNAGPCSTIVGNVIENVSWGISLSYDNIMVDSNVLNRIGDDGMQITASNITIRRNRITNMLDIGDDNHSDMIQAFNLSNSVFHDILIDGNTCINQTDPNLNFPQPEAQGITEFDGQWTNYFIVNNVVVTNHWHGISLYGATNGQIINNTVFGADASRVPWIGAFDSKTGAHPVNNIIRNNLSGTYSFDTGTSADHNITAADPLKQVVRFDRNNFIYDLHLLPNASAVGAGNATLAPATDIGGFARSNPIDAGAYAAANGN